MRKLLAAAVLVLGGLGAVACQPTEPAMTISAKVYDPGGTTPPQYTTCGYTYTFKGAVNPKNATTKVVLQHRAGGKWVDTKGWNDQDAWYDVPASLRQASVSQATGGYTIRMMIDWLGSTRQFRVRSSGGGYTSTSLYLKPTGWDGVCG